MPGQVLGAQPQPRVRDDRLGTTLVGAAPNARIWAADPPLGVVDVHGQWCVAPVAVRLDSLAAAYHVVGGKARNALMSLLASSTVNSDDDSISLSIV